MPIPKTAEDLMRMRQDIMRVIYFYCEAYGFDEEDVHASLRIVTGRLRGPMMDRLRDAIKERR